MKKVDLAYIAGLFDGEGSICIERNGRRFWIYVGVIMTDEYIIRWLQFVFGGSIYHYAPRGISKKDQWRWRTVGPQAIPVLKALMPYLRLKKAQAELAIEFQKKMNIKDRGKRLIGLDVAEREVYKILMHKLNKGESLEGAQIFDSAGKGGTDEKFKRLNKAYELIIKSRGPQ